MFGPIITSFHWVELRVFDLTLVHAPLWSTLISWGRTGILQLPFCVKDHTISRIVSLAGLWGAPLFVVLRGSQTPQFTKQISNGKKRVINFLCKKPWAHTFLCHANIPFLTATAYRRKVTGERRTTSPFYRSVFSREPTPACVCTFLNANEPV